MNIFKRYWIRLWNNYLRRRKRKKFGFNFIKTISVIESFMQQNELLSSRMSSAILRNVIHLRKLYIWSLWSKQFRLRLLGNPPFQNVNLKLSIFKSLLDCGTFTQIKTIFHIWKYFPFRFIVLKWSNSENDKACQFVHILARLISKSLLSLSLT